LMLPEAAFQVTDLSVAVPWTFALKAIPPPVVADADAGEMLTEVTPAVGEGAVTVTVAEADFVVSATLVAVTVSVPPFAGAV
jgi:hypothetical protein